MRSETYETAVILISGGLDSATAMAEAASRTWRCACLTIDYGQRNRAEIDAAIALAASAQAFDHRIVRVDLRAIGGSALTDDIPVPHRGEFSTDTGIPVTYVPARNALFLSLAAGYAEVVGASILVVGVNAVDFSGYPDCRPDFIQAMQRALNLGTRVGVESSAGGLRIHAPLLHLSKAEIIRLGTRLGVDYALTRSCYDPPEDHLACGLCDACVLRKRGFAEAGVTDPTRYAERVP